MGLLDVAMDVAIGPPWQSQWVAIHSLLSLPPAPSNHHQKIVSYLSLDPSSKNIPLLNSCYWFILQNLTTFKVSVIIQVEPSDSGEYLLLLSFNDMIRAQLKG